MREVMIRRMLVLALCTSGVVALWVVADRSASIPQTADRTLPAPRRTGQVAVPASYAATATPTAHAARSGPYDPTAIRTVRAVPASGGSPRTGHRPRRDDRPPAAVTAVQVLANSHESVTVSWAPVRDRSGIAYYQATLNGIPAGETAGRQLTVDWFNDDMSAHFIQVRAVDGPATAGRAAVR